MIMALLSPWALMIFFGISAQFKPYSKTHLSLVLVASGVWIAVSVFMTTRQFSMKWMLLAALLIGAASAVPQLINCTSLYPK